MRIPLSFDLAGLQATATRAESIVDASMNRMQARINSVHGPNLGGGGVGANLSRGGNQFVGAVSGMGALSTGLGIGAAVSGMAMLEQGFSRAIRKAKEFQTATLAIAATLGSIGSWQGAGGRPLPQSQQAQRNMWEAEKYRQTILVRSAKNILTFDEQLQSFQSGLASGARKGLKPDQIMKLTEQTAIVAKTLGLRGEQISNASRLLMGGGVNVARSTIGRALGISNADISSRSGPQLERFLQSKMRGFDQMQSKFEGSIEGMVSTLEAKIDVLSARAGAKFMKGIAPTLKSIGMLSEPTRDQYEKGATGQAKFTKELKEYQKQSKTMDTLVGAAAQGFNGLFNGVKAVVESESFKTLLDILVRISSVSKQIMLAMVFSKIASSVMAATGAMQRFLAVAGVTSALSGGGKGSIMPADLARVALTSSSRGLAGVGATGAGAALGLAGYGSAMPLLRDPGKAGLKAATAARYLRGNDLALERGGAAGVVGSLGYGAAKDSSVAGRIGVRGQRAIERAAKAAGRADYFAINKQLPILAQEEKMLMSRIPHMQSMGMSTVSEEARLAAIQNERNALVTTQSAIPNNYLPASGRFRAVGTNLGARLPMGMMGLMGGQMIKESGLGLGGNLAGSAVQGSALGYMLGGNRPGFGAAVGAVGGLGSGIAGAGKAASMVDLKKGTTAGQYGAMALGGAMKWGATGAMIGSLVAPGVGTAIGGGLGAIAGGILEPLIASMDKTAASAKAAAKAIDDFREANPQKAAIMDAEKAVKKAQAAVSAAKGTPAEQKAKEAQRLADIERGKNAVPGSAEYMTAQFAKSQNYSNLPQLETGLTQAQHRLNVLNRTATYKVKSTDRATRIAQLQGNIKMYSGVMNQGPAAQRKLLAMQREMALLNAEENIGAIPTPGYDENADLQRMRGPQEVDYPNHAAYLKAKSKFDKSSYGMELQRKFKVWKKNPDNTGDFDSFIGAKAGNKTLNIQKGYLPGIKGQIGDKFDLEKMNQSYAKQALKALAQGKKGLAEYISFKSEQTQKASQFDQGLRDPEYQKYIKAQLQEKQRILKEDARAKAFDLETTKLDLQKLGVSRGRAAQDAPRKIEQLKIEATNIDIASRQTNLDLAKLQATGMERIAIQDARLALDTQRIRVRGQSLANEGEQIGIDMFRNGQTRGRVNQDYPLNMAEGRLNLQTAQMNQRAAAGAPALFYGNMGPVQGAAASIRSYVESEFAQKFDASKYEEAYRDKLKMEEEQMGVAQELAAINTKRASLGLDRIEEDYANTLVDLTMQLKGLKVAAANNKLDIKGNALDYRQNRVDIIDQSFARTQYGLDVEKLQNQQRSNAFAKESNSIEQQRTGEDAAIQSKDDSRAYRLLTEKYGVQSRAASEAWNTLHDVTGIGGASKGLSVPSSLGGLIRKGNTVGGPGIGIGPAGMTPEALKALQTMPGEQANAAYSTGGGISTGNNSLPNTVASSNTVNIGDIVGGPSAAELGKTIKDTVQGILSDYNKLNSVIGKGA